VQVEMLTRFGRNLSRIARRSS